MTEILQASDQLNALLDAAVDSIIIIDELGTIESFNRAAERMFGYSESEVAGRNVSLLMPEPDRSAHDAYMGRYLESGVPHIIGVGREVDARRKDGTVFPAFLSVGRVANSSPVRFVGFLQDVTTRREAMAVIQREREREEDARHLQERLMHVSRFATMGEMASGIAHELNQPLAAITTYAQACERLIALPEPDLPEVKEALQQIAAQALRAGEIILRMRHLVRSEATQRETCSVNELMDEVALLARSDARLHDARLRFELAVNLPALYVDRVQVLQLLLILLRNAIDALGALPSERREIVVTARSADAHCVELTIADQGAGIEPGTAERMFDPFFTTKSNGSGLGLSIARTIARVHDGMLSYRPGRPFGSEFFTRLPSSLERAA